MEKMSKKILIIVVCVICFLTLLLGIICFFNKDGNNVDNKTTTSKVINTNLENEEDNIHNNVTTEITTTILTTTTTSKETTIKISKVKSSTKISTTKKKTTIKETTKETTTKRYVVSESTEEIEALVTHKYGVKVTTYETYSIKKYSDGEVQRKKTKTRVVYDKDGFDATTSELLSEAKALVSKNQSIYNDILNYTNGYRSEKNISALILNQELSVAATVRALEMAWSGAFKANHERPDGRTCFTVLSDLGYRYQSAGENIAKGFTSAKGVSNGWRESPGHYSNMIDGDFGKLGVGMAEVDGTKYWVQIFSN